MSREVDEPADVYQTTLRVSRKERRCTACCDLIRPGDVYVHVYMVWEGGPYCMSRCARCETIHAHLREKCRAERANRWPDDNLNCGDEYVDNWGEGPPPEIASLAFAMPGEVVLNKERKGEER